MNDKTSDPLDTVVEGASVVEPLPVEDSRQRARFDAIVKGLGKPHAQGDRYAIYNGDCVQLLDHLNDGTIDLTFTSPPYNIGKEYERVLPLDEYVQWCGVWMNKLHRVTASDGAFMLNLGYVEIMGRAKNLPLTYLLWDKSPFFLMQEIVWNYGAGVAAKFSLSPRNEKLLWFVKSREAYTFNLDDIRDPDVAYPNQKKKGKLRCNTIGKNPSDVWQIAKVTSGEGRASKERMPHPAQFPHDLVERAVRGFAPRGGVVLDPFLGSGSTADTSLRTGRFCIGFELRKDYCDMAAARLRLAEDEARSLF
jgi:adenine-specific DNA-methyltransferase